jgi:2-oxoacid:acceptor oxidoreductase delta subunit (pyruvate/2-ketoisovalerate family)
MGELKAWNELPAGGAVAPGETPRQATGAWRTGLKPRAQVDKCVNCLLCWLYCPDSAILLDGTVFAGFDYDVCKGCELCAEVCPVEAVEMVPEPTPVPARGLVRGGRNGHR